MKAIYNETNSRHDDDPEAVAVCVLAAGVEDHWQVPRHIIILSTFTTTEYITVDGFDHAKAIRKAIALYDATIAGKPKPSYKQAVGAFQDWLTDAANNDPDAGIFAIDRCPFCTSGLRPDVDYTPKHDDGCPFEALATAGKDS